MSISGFSPYDLARMQSRMAHPDQAADPYRYMATPDLANYLRGNQVAQDDYLARIDKERQEIQLRVDSGQFLQADYDRLAQISAQTQGLREHFPDDPTFQAFLQERFEASTMEANTIWHHLNPG